MPAVSMRASTVHFSTACYTPQRPTRCALEQKPWDVQRWMQEVYPLIAEKAKQEDGIVHWADETAVAQDGRLGAGA